MSLAFALLGAIGGPQNEIPGGNEAMRLVPCLVVLVLAAGVCHAQVSGAESVFAKSYSKTEALHKAKAFLFQEILHVGTSVVQVSIDALAATDSGELTSLVYESAQSRGLVFGFFNWSWKDSGAVYQKYAFKRFPEESARALLTKLDAVLDEQSKYVAADKDNNTASFVFEDALFVIYWDAEGGAGKVVRVFWNGFDSEWTATAFSKTKKRLEKKLTG